jgi:beta-lactamase class A
MQRRSFLVGGAGVLMLPAMARAGLPDAIPAIERRSGGRLGVAVVDREGRHPLGHRLDERFPMCSTFKALAAGAILARVDAGKERLERVVRFSKADVVSYSPATGSQADGPGMTLAALCEAGITLSDNTAGNLMLDAIGGPAGLTAFARSLGDATTRLDRRETDLNSAIPGDVRDTTSPAAMARSYARLAFGDGLSPASRARLIGWLKETRTGAARLRAGLPADWIEGDKTGAGDHGTSNDVAILWPPSLPPIVVACYLTGSPLDPPARDAVLAEVGRAIAGLPLSNLPQ